VTRSRRLFWPAVVVLMFVVVFAADCSSSTSTTTSTSTAPGTTVSSTVPDDLRMAIFAQLPANYIEEPAGSGADGPLGLAATAEAVDDEQPARQDVLLEQDGFRRAYQRAWVVKGTHEVLIIRVQLMGSPGQALGYFNLLTFAGRVSTQLTAFPMPGLTGASGFTRPFTTSAGPQVAQDVNLVRGPLFYHLILTGPRGSITPADVLSIARSQSSEAASLGYT
jgi:hypothetical protein